MLSMPTRDEINRSKGKSRDSSAQKFSRDKPLTEKYKVFSDFEKNVLAMVKSEINEMTDLWFDYERCAAAGFGNTSSFISSSSTKTGKK